MTDPRIPDEIVAKAVIAKGNRAADEGVGHTMRRALEAVIDDLLTHICPRQCPDCPHHQPTETTSMNTINGCQP